MSKRIVEFLFGVMITIVTLASYGDSNNPRKLLVGYVTTSGVLQIIIMAGLLMLASRLIAGKPKDYSKTCYNFLVKFFGLPKKGG